MSLRIIITTLAICFSPFPAHAQIVTAEPDPVLNAISESSPHASPKTTAVPENQAATSPAAAEPPSAAVRVIGKPPAVEPPAVEPPAVEPPAVIATLMDPTTTKLENGLALRVENLQAAKGPINPSQVKLSAPFPAKPLSPPPAGWHFDASETAPPFTREVEIAPGTRITLSVRPHLLIPDLDTAQVFSVPEPGYNSTLGYQQTATVGAILSNSLTQLGEQSKQLGTTLANLQQLLSSLPRPETKSLLPDPVKPLSIHK